MKRLQEDPVAAARNERRVVHELRLNKREGTCERLHKKESTCKSASPSEILGKHVSNHDG